MIVVSATVGAIFYFRSKMRERRRLRSINSELKNCFSECSIRTDNIDQVVPVL